MTWTRLTTGFTVPAKPRGLWTLVLDYVDAPATLKIVAADDATWSYTPGIWCDADGDLTAMIARARCLLEKGPVGALIGKLGGSTAGSDDGTLFLAGQSCVVNVAQGNGGPLYLTINDEITGLGNNAGTISVEVLRSIQAA